MLMYTVLAGTETVEMPAETSLTNKCFNSKLFLGGRGFKSCDIDKNIIFMRKYE